MDEEEEDIIAISDEESNKEDHILKPALEHFETERFEEDLTHRPSYNRASERKTDIEFEIEDLMIDKRNLKRK